MKRKLIGAVVAMLTCVAWSAGEWTTGPNDCDAWSANLKNLFLDATVSGGDSSLANRSVAKEETYLSNNAVVTFTLAKEATVSAINFYSHHRDAGCDGICVTSIEVCQNGVWSTLANSAVEYGTKTADSGNISHGTTTGSLKALFADADGSDLASGVSAVRINFGAQDNGGTRYGEIEAIGTYTDGTRHLTITSIDSDFGTIACSPASADGWYAEDSTVTVTFTPADSVSFLKWSGDVTAAQVPEASITLTMDGSYKITPYAYSSTWIYKNGVLSDGLRSLNASGAAGAITITSTKDLGGTNIVDLSLGIRDGGQIVGISSLTGVKTLYLPDTLTTIAGRAFVNSSLVKVVPFLPDSVTSIGGGAFADSYSLGGDLRIGWGTDAEGAPLPVTFGIHDGVRSIAFQSVAVGPTVSLGPGVTSIIPYTFSSSGAITNLYLGSNVTTIAEGAFSGLGSSKCVDVVFAGDAPATLATTAFGSTAKSQYVRFHLPWEGGEDHPGWHGLITNTEKVLPWQDIDSETRAAYRAAFPSATWGSQKPYGLTRAAAATGTPCLPADQWVMVANDTQPAVWQTGSLVTSTWTANGSNILYNVACSDTSLNALSDAKMAEFGNNGNVGSGKVISWTLAQTYTIYSISVYTCYHDAGRDGINVEKVEVKVSGSDDWVDLGLPSVEFATLNVDGGNISHGNYDQSTRTYTLYAKCAKPSGLPLETDVTAVRVTFGSPQDNSCSGYGEIEVIGFSDAGWELEVASLDPELGTIAISPSSETGFYKDGTTVNVTLTPADGVSLVRWEGSVPEGQTTSTSLSFTMSAARVINAVTLAPYLIFKNGRLFDGTQNYSASGTTNAISVTGCTRMGDGGVIDLTKPVSGDGTIVSVGGFEGVEKGSISTVRFPDTLETIGFRAFCQRGSFTVQTGLEFPSLTWLGGGCFADDGLKGDVRLGFAQNADGSYKSFTFGIHDTSDTSRSIAFQGCGVGPNVWLGPGVTTIPSYAFSSSGNITNLWLGPNVSFIGKGTFNGIGVSKLATITFEGDLPATINATAFGTPSAYKVRMRPLVTATQSDTRWNALLADTAKVTPWGRCTDEQRSAYWNNFPRAAYGMSHPYGLTTSTAAADNWTIPANVWIFDEWRMGTLMRIR